MTLLRAFATTVLILLAGAAHGQAMLPSAGADNGGAVQSALEALESSGNTVIVVPQGANGGDVAAAAGPSLEERIASVREQVGEIIANAPMLPGQIAGALRAAGDGSLTWLWWAALLMVISWFFGALAYWFVHRVARRIGGDIWTRVPDTQASMIARDLSVLARYSAAAIAFFAVGALTALIIHPELSPERVTATMAVSSVAIFMIVRGVLLAIMAPGRGEKRPLPFDDNLARSLYLQLMATGVIANVVAFLCYWLANFPLLQLSHQLLLLIAPTASVLLFAIVCAVHRKELSAAFRPKDARPAKFRRFLAVAWPAIVAAYLIGAWALTVFGVVEKGRLAFGPVLSPFLALIVTMGVVGILTIFQERQLRSSVRNEAWATLFSEVVLRVAVFVGFVTLAAVWRLFSDEYGGIAYNVFGFAFVLLIAWSIWRAVKLFVALRLAEEEPDGAGDAEGEGFGPGGSRLATLLPIVRNVICFVIASIVLMFGLASLGVDVAPLFAGAGVVGLAIGFGAQALIRDVFSGAFFLLDDAFRKGEYVEVGAVTGMVEKISVRSFQLRHHEGALHTLPFGEIKQLTNYSRDWVIMKLPIRLTYDTDVEKVRKLIKKLGQEMADDPEYGHLFLEPPKSQGVVQMDDSAMIMRVKFKTKPGDQFILRRNVFAKLRELFEQNDIHFAHREVTVRVAGTDDEDVKRRAALGAVRAGGIEGAGGGAGAELADAMTSKPA
ncbi:MAG: mechanosensitive ion channel family protein [Pseudomonadota bacterium]